MSPRLPIVATILPPLLFWVAALSAAPRWRTLETEHCTILSQLSEDDTRQWASGFEQFVAAAQNLLVIDEAMLDRPKLLLFARGHAADYKPLNPNQEVRHNIAGMYLGIGIIALEEGRDYYGTRRVLFHESTHWLLTGAPTTVPLWLNEGLAEVFATFEPGREYGVVGLSFGPHVDQLQQTGWVPWAEVLRATHRDPLYREDSRAWLFYAQSWLFAHRLLFDDPAEGRLALDRHTRARQHGADPTRAFTIAIERDFVKVEAQLQNYLRKTAFKPRRLARPAAATISAPFARAEHLATEETLAKLAISVRRADIASAHIERVRALAPESPKHLELTAWRERVFHRRMQAAAIAREAIQRGSTDKTMALLVAEAVLDEQLESAEGDDARLRQLAQPYIDATNEGKQAALFEGLARVSVKLAAPTEADIALLLRGRRRFPDCAWICVGLAAMKLRLGQHNEARDLLDQALTRPEIRDRTLVMPRGDQALAVRVEAHLANIKASIAQANLVPAIREFEALLKIDVPND